jgi:hypothetical protein
MIPDKAAAVLRDYRKGTSRSATELAKLHGVSRSAVYRLIAKEPVPATGSARVSADAEASTRHTTEHKSLSIADTLYSKAEAFANTLGLPDDAGKITHVEPESKEDEEEKERLLDAAMEAMLGRGTADSYELNLPKGLEEALVGASPPPPRVPRIETAEAEVEAPIIEQPRLNPFNEARRAEITQKIIFNVQHFGAQLEVLTGTGRDRDLFLQSLSSQSTPQLKELLTTLERTRSVGNMAAGFKQVFYVAAQATEATSQFVGMRTEGFLQQLKAQDEEITMIMKELAIEQWERLKAMDSPPARLGLLFCATLIQVDSRNRLADHFKQTSVPQSMREATADL